MAGLQGFRQIEFDLPFRFKDRGEKLIADVLDEEMAKDSIE